MPLRVQWGLADVHGIGLGTWSLPEPMDLGRAHMDGTRLPHTHTHTHTYITHPWGGCTRHSTHRMHSTHTHSAYTGTHVCTQAHVQPLLSGFCQ